MAGRVNPAQIKEMLLKWSRAKTKEYDGVNIENFGNSWADGMAFAALIHHFFPDSFDFKACCSPSNRKENLSVAFKTIEEKLGLSPMITVEDMILMGNNPDPKCIFTYLQAVYKKLADMKLYDK